MCTAPPGASPSKDDGGAGGDRRADLGTSSINELDQRLRIEDNVRAAKQQPTKKHKDASGEAAISHQHLAALSLAPVPPPSRNSTDASSSKTGTPAAGATGKSSSVAATAGSLGAAAAAGNGNTGNTRKRQQLHSPAVSASSGGAPPPGSSGTARAAAADAAAEAAGSPRLGACGSQGDDANEHADGADSPVVPGLQRQGSSGGGNSCGGGSSGGPPSPSPGNSRPASPSSTSASPRLPAQHQQQAQALACNGQGPAAGGGASGSSGGGRAAVERGLRLGELLLCRGRAAEAQQAAEEVLRDDPDQPDALCLKAKCLATAGNNAAAYATLALALASDPLHSDSHAACAALYQAAGDLDEAAASLRRAIACSRGAAAEAGGGSGGAGGTRSAVGGRAAAGGAAGVAGVAGGGGGGGAVAGGGRAGGGGGAAGGAARGGGGGEGGGGGGNGGRLGQQPAAGPPAGLALQLATVLTDKGTKLKGAGRLLEAEALYLEALAACPGYAPAVYNRGVLAAEAARDEDAMVLYREAVRLQPRYAEALCNMGVLHKKAGDLHRAVEAYEASLLAAPGFSVVRCNLAIALTELGTIVKSQGNMDEAIRLYERALAVQPKHADAMYNLGVAFGETRQLDKSIFMYEAALWLNPQCAEAWNNLGVLLKEAGDLPRAEACYTAALNARPHFPQGLNNLAVIYTAQGRAREAFSLLQAAVMAAPSYAEAYNNLGVLQRDLGQVPEAISSYERCMQLCSNAGNAAQNRLLALNYLHHGESRLVCAAHEEWGAALEAATPRLPPPSREERRAAVASSIPSAMAAAAAAASTARDCAGSAAATSAAAAVAAAASAGGGGQRPRPLCVGYVSPDLFTHSVSYFSEAPLTRHRRGAVSWHVYSCVQQPDAKTARLRAAVLGTGGQWHDVARLTDQALAEMVRSHGVDVLVELTGHTAHNRLAALARKPAPVQVTWVGYPNSTGLGAVDYRLTDAVADPIDTQQTFVERLVRLPRGCFLCYTPSPDAPHVGPLPALANGYVTFGSFNALAKITPEVMQVWACILESVPHSRLLLKSKPFACDAARQHYTGVMREQGIDTRRVDLLPLAADNRDHLATYQAMDISLDPWPYAGTTTTCESLLMGVPCVTLQGGCHAHNVGASLLTAVGLAGSGVGGCGGVEDGGDGAGGGGGVRWVARSVDEYVAAAVAAASDLQALSDLRTGLRQRMLSSRLCDAEGFVAELEEAYYAMWREWLGGRGDVGDGGGGGENSVWRGAEAASATSGGSIEDDVIFEEKQSEAGRCHQSAIQGEGGRRRDQGLLLPTSPAGPSVG